MVTDWALVRELMSAAIDACEAAERSGLGEEDRALPTGTGSVRDLASGLTTWYREQMVAQLGRAAALKQTGR